MNALQSPYKITGLILSAFGVIGYFTIADELHHFGEFIGVTTVLLSGVILFFAEYKKGVLKNISIQWIAFSLLASIPVGGVLLDNMPLGVGLGFFIGILLALLLGRRKITHG